MARDLVFGKIPRDWSCGAGLFNLPSRERLADDAVASREAPALARQVELEVQKTYAEIVRLTAARKLPADVRRAFVPTWKRWQASKEAHPDGFRGQDYVELRDVLDEVRRYSGKLPQYDELPPTQPGPSSRDTASDLTAYSQPKLRPSVPVLAAAGLVVALVARATTHHRGVKP